MKYVIYRKIKFILIKEILSFKREYLDKS